MDVDCQFKHDKVEAVTIYITFVRSTSQLTEFYEDRFKKSNTDSISSRLDMNGICTPT